MAMHAFSSQWPFITNQTDLKDALLAESPGVIVAADNDGFWQKHLSVRFNSAPFEKRLADFVSFLDEVRQKNLPFAVALCVEELCPGGLDATDGIAIARAAEKAGAMFIIASGGTEDFPLLKHRRPTHNKHTGEDFETNEPWLASALWLIGKVQIPIYAKDEGQDPVKAEKLAKSIGLSGLWHKKPW